MVGEELTATAHEELYREVERLWQLRERTPAEEQALNESQTRLFASVEPSISRFREPLVAFAGWLLTNPDFLAEHRQLFQDHAAFIGRHGIPRLVTAASDYRTPAERRVAGAVPPFDPADLGASEQGPAGSEAACEDFETFYVRWRLQRLETPFLPEPIPPMLPVLHLPSVLGHMRAGGQVFYLPDIFPIPGRDELRELLDDNLRDVGPDADHLSEWRDIIGVANPSKNQLVRFARQFRVQHAARALYSRHSEALRRQRGRVILALAAWLGVSDETVRDDLDLISRRLGNDWESYPL